MKTDPAETTNVANSNPDTVLDLTRLAKTTRQELGEFMQRGKSQRPTGSLFSHLPVISHEKDWGTLDSATTKAITEERAKRHPNQKPPNRKRQAEH